MESTAYQAPPQAATPGASPSSTPRTPERMTYEEFLDWAEEGSSAEWVEGEVILMTPASDRHQDLADFLTVLVRLYVEAHQLGQVRSAPFQMKTGEDLPGREPDLPMSGEPAAVRSRGTARHPPLGIRRRGGVTAGEPRSAPAGFTAEPLFAMPSKECPARRTESRSRR